MADENQDTIEKAIAASPLAKLKLMYPAFAVGPLALIAVSFALEVSNKAPQDLAQPILAYAALGLTLLSSALALVALPKVLFENQLSNIFAASKPLDPFLRLLFTLRLLQAAMLEGAALFGAIVIFLGVNQDLIERQPIHWAGALPVFILLGFVALFTPTTRGIAELYEGLKQRHAS